MSSAITRFPSAKAIKDFLSSYEVLNQPYFRENGITQAISTLAGKRFADKRFADGSMDKTEIKLGILTIVIDLRKGKDGFTGEKLPKIVLPQMTWDLLSKAIESALIACRNKPVEGKVITS